MSPEKLAVEEAHLREQLLQLHGSKSAVIRHLAAEGWSRTEIANFLEIKYQHVRSVLVTPLAGQSA